MTSINVEAGIRRPHICVCIKLQPKTTYYNDVKTLACRVHIPNDNPYCFVVVNLNDSMPIIFIVDKCSPSGQKLVQWVVFKFGATGELFDLMLVTLMLP